MRVTPEKQSDAILKLLITLLAEPRVNAEQLGKALGRTESWVNKMIMAFRDAGIDIEYDKTNKRYTVGLSDDYRQGLLGKYAKTLARILSKAEFNRPPVQFVAQLNRYDIEQFAKYIGTSPSNVHNMLTGYQGAKLPTGWCGYQLVPNGKWYVQKMIPNRTGKAFSLPDNVKDVAYRIVVGEGSPITAGHHAAVERSRCLVNKPVQCKEPVLARGFCSTHYYQQRRHPERFPKPLEPTLDIIPKEKRKKKTA